MTIDRNSSTGTVAVQTVCFVVVVFGSPVRTHSPSTVSTEGETHGHERVVKSK